MRLLLLACLVACAPRHVPVAAPVPSAEPAMLPPAFDAATLRAGFGVGTVVRYRIVESGTPRVEEWTVTAADDETCTMIVRKFIDEGATLVHEATSTTSWSDLAAHGTFPAAATTRTDASVDVPAGHFDTWRYDVAADEKVGMTRTFHFSPASVGPPVWAEFRNGDEVIVSMQLLSRTTVTP